MTEGSDSLPIAERLRAALSRRYAVHHEIGRGGMAIVVLARDMQHERDVAIKVLRPDVASAIGSERFLREVKVAARLSHPGILPLHDSGSANGLLYFVMPHVAGESLRERLDREGQLPIDEAITIAREVADALSYAHSHDVVHRDVKPENILLASGHPLITDFGVSCAISGSGEVRLTAAGVSLGTPGYMSPEQPGEKHPVDGRSDIYSLGCVLYEMLAGEPPFTGPSAQAVLTRHLSEPPRPLHNVRPTVARPLEAVIERMLAKVPADRFATAREVAEALASPESMAGATRRTKQRSWLIGISAMAAVALIALGARFQLGSAPRVDDTLFAILPLQQRAGMPPAFLNGSESGSLLYEAFNRWSDLRLVNPLLVSDMQSRFAEDSITASGAVDLAASLGAGRAVWGEVWRAGDSSYIRASLYDVGNRGRVIRSHMVAVAESAADISGRFTELASELLRGPAPTLSSIDLLGTHSFAAWRHYEAGHEALAGWDLDTASREFRAALEDDPGYAQASLWLAQSLQWAGQPRQEWEPAARRASLARASLPPTEGRHAGALLALAEARYPAACEAYRDIVARDSLDFRAWLGLGECQSRDRIVVPDSASPSGFAFRGSYHAAIEAYRRALQLIPSFPFVYSGSAYDRLAGLLYAESSRFRSGFAPGTDTLWFGSFPGLAGDTIRLVPQPLHEVLDFRPDLLPENWGAAVDRNRGVLVEVMRSWAEAFPDSARAQESLALAYEALGRLTGDNTSALAAIVRARSTRVTDADVAIRLAVHETRFRLKVEAFADVYRLADSVLAANPAPSPVGARHLAGLAALLGRINLCADLLERAALVDTLTLPDGRPTIVPLQVHQAAARLLAFAAFGAPVDSIRALEGEIERRIIAFARPDLRDDLRAAALVRPGMMAYFERGPGFAHQSARWLNPFTRMETDLARGDTARVRAARDALHQWRVARQRSRPADVAADGVLLDAKVALALGDTAGAMDELATSLASLAAHGSFLTRDVPQAAGVVRDMALLAELKAAAGDTATARRWAGAVVTLWQGSAPSLGAMVQGMQRLASPSGRR